MSTAIHVGWVLLPALIKRTYLYYYFDKSYWRLLSMLLNECSQKLQEHLTKIGRSKETARSYLHHNRMFIRHFDEKRNCPTYLEDITIDDIEAYQHMLQVEKNYKPASVNLSLNAIRSMFKLAVRREWIDKNPADHIDPVRVVRQERDFLGEEDVHQLLGNIKHPLIKLVVRTLAYTGLRISECLNLTLDDVDLEKNLIQVIAGKGNKDRVVPISPTLKKYLKDYLENYRPNTVSTLFFATERTGMVSAVYVNRVLQETCRALGWEKHVSAHALRHSFASRLAASGTSIPVLASLLGHADYRTVTSIYIHTDADQLASAVNHL